MSTFESRVAAVGRIAFPSPTGVRVMMLPFRLEDVRGTLPDFVVGWHAAVESLVALSRIRRGVAYLTIDEADVAAGETHRRPGLHVDGVGPNGEVGAWGGGGGYASNGMLVASSVRGSRGWDQRVRGDARGNGDAAHLSGELRRSAEVVMDPGVVYACGSLAVHEGLPMRHRTMRQFVRVSMPSKAPWYEGYTRNPLGVEPTGPVKPRRTSEMGYRP